MNEDAVFKIIRFYQDEQPNKFIKGGLTLDEAKAHCADPSTSGEGWFDGYTREEQF
jgi:hypothetical protein